MERKLNRITREPNLVALNQRTCELAQLIASTLANMINPRAPSNDSNQSLSSNQQQHQQMNDSNTTTTTTTNMMHVEPDNFDWPDSFMRLLDSLAAKQQQQQQSLLTMTKTTNNDYDSLETSERNNENNQQSISSTSSLAIDDRDFELVDIKSIDFIDTNNNNDDDNNEFPDGNLRWLLNITNSANSNYCTSPSSIFTFESELTNNNNLLLPIDWNQNNNNDNENEHQQIENAAENNNTNDEQTNTNDRNLINLMKILRKKSASNEKINNSSSTTTKQNDEFRRCKTLPFRFNQITRIEFADDQLKLPAFESMLIVQDFDEDDEEVDGEESIKSSVGAGGQFDSAEATNNKLLPLSKQRQELELNKQQQNEKDKRNKKLSSKQQQQPEEDSIGGSVVCSNRSQQSILKGNQASGGGDDGKHSLLQFALYNFREAVDKYSLASSSRESDTSTLRGSLKLLESLRSGGSRNSSTSNKSTAAATRNSLLANNQHQQQEQQLSGTVPTADGQTTDWTWRELAEMVKWTSQPIKQSLLKLDNDELNRRAVDCFIAIMQYTGDINPVSSSLAPTSTCGSPLTGSSHGQNTKQQLQLQQQPSSEVECVYLILMNCHNFPSLRDELYCQLMKQTTSNRSNKQDSCLRAWRLFSMVAAYFDCSDSFRPYLLKYLETAAFDKRRAYCSVAALCLQNLRKTLKYGGRKNVPSIEEIAATSAGRNSKRQIYRLPGGTERVINTKSTTVVEDIIRDICQMLGIQEHNEMFEFSLYCIADGDLYTMPLNRDEYILDVTTELVKNHQHYFLIFCRSIWHYPLRLDSRLYVEVIFNQVAPDYLEGLLVVLPGFRAGGSKGNFQQPLRLRTKLVKEVARIAALLHRASGTDYMPHKDEIRYLLPKPLVAALRPPSMASLAGSTSITSHDRTQAHPCSGSQSGISTSTISSKATDNNNTSQMNNISYFVDTSPQKWIELVQDNWREMSAFDTLDAKAQFLEILRHWPLFGSSFFAIKLIQRDLIQPSEFVLALNKLGIQMLDTESHETVHRYPLNEVISTRKVRSEDGALFLDVKCGNLMKRTIIRIQTDQAHEISRLIKQYIEIELLQQRQQPPLAAAAAAPSEQADDGDQATNNNSPCKKEDN